MFGAWGVVLVSCPRFLSHSFFRKESWVCAQPCSAKIPAFVAPLLLQRLALANATWSARAGSLVPMPEEELQSVLGSPLLHMTARACQHNITGEVAATERLSSFCAQERGLSEAVICEILQAWSCAGLGWPCYTHGRDAIINVEPQCGSCQTPL